MVSLGPGCDGEPHALPSPNGQGIWSTLQYLHRTRAVRYLLLCDWLVGPPVLCQESSSCTFRWRVIVPGQWSRARVLSSVPRLPRYVCPNSRRRVNQRLVFQAWVQKRLLDGAFSGERRGRESVLVWASGVGLCGAPGWPLDQIEQQSWRRVWAITFGRYLCRR
jgi:hypothetical protein